MATYAALVSLTNTIHNIQNHSRLSTSLDKNQIESLGEKLDLLLEFVENHHSHAGNEEAKVLESQIASAAHAAEDVIESHIVDLIEPLMAGPTIEREETSTGLLLDLLIYVMLHIENHPGLSTSSLDREQIESLCEKLDFLLDIIENPNSHVNNEEAEVLERQIESEARAVEDAFSLQKDRLDSCQAEIHLPGTFSCWLLDFFLLVMGQILNYPRLWTSLKSEKLKEFRKSLDDLDDTESSFSHFVGVMASEAMVAEDVIEAQEAGSTFDHDETSSGSMTTLQKEVNATKKKVMKVQEKICGKKVVFAGSGNSFLPDLQKVLEDMDSLKEKVIKINAERGFKDVLPTYSMPRASSSSLTTGKTSVVGF